MPELSIAEAVGAARRGRRLSVAALAERSGVSRAMISKIERGDTHPTAQLLARIAAACDLTLSRLIEAAESHGQILNRRAQQTVWSDPATGYTRRALSPTPAGPLQLAEIELPAGAVVGYAPHSYPVAHQQIWVLDGELQVTHADGTVQLGPGDCLLLERDGERRYHNPGPSPCRYLVAIANA